MKPPLLLTASALLLATLLVGGCATPQPIALSPAVAMTAPTARFSDKRTEVAIYREHNPSPAREVVVGALFGVTNFSLANGKTAAEMIAGATNRIVPTAQEVTLKRFWTTYTIGLWVGAAWCDISADVTLADNRVVTVTGHGKNTAMSATPRNLELAIERAIEDFQKCLSMESAMLVKP